MQAAGKGINIKEVTMIAFLFIYCINFLNVGSYVAVLLIPFVIAYVFRERIGKKSLIAGFYLLAFFISYSVFLYFYQYSNPVSIIGKIVYPISFFFIGHWLVKGDLNYKRTVKYLFTIIISFTLYGLLSTLKAGDTSSIGRVGIDIWTGGMVSATALNAWLAFGLSLSALLFIKDRSLHNWKKIKCFSLVCFIASTYGVIQLGNRTGIVIIVVTFIITLLFVSKVSTRKILNAGILGAFLVFVTFLYNANIFGIKYSVEYSYLFSRFTDSSLGDDPRVDSWIAAFWGIFENPLGGKITSMRLGSAHNMWLDVGYEAGIIPFALLSFFTLMTLTLLRKFLRRNHPKLIKGLFLSLYFSFMLTFFVEPILLGLNEYFTIFCLLVGMMYRLNQDHHLRKDVIENMDNNKKMKRKRYKITW